MTQLHISKLTEASWIQDARTARDRRQLTQALFRSYQEEVTHIVMLRPFRMVTDDTPEMYQLVEIPTTIFDSIHDATLADFASDAPSVRCLADGKPVATVSLDRSDAKITVRRIQLEACTVHAEWKPRACSHGPKSVKKLGHTRACRGYLAAFSTEFSTDHGEIAAASAAMTALWA